MTKPYRSPLSPFLLFLPAAAIFVFAVAAVSAAIPANATPQSAPAAPVATNGPHANVANPVTPTAASRARAKTLYGIDCAMCHGDSGNGKSDIATSMGVTLPDFTQPSTLAGLSDGQIFDIIRSGTGTGNAKMTPETPDRASDTDVWNLVLYLRGLSKH